ncbi:MAG: serine/threonine protein kinase [Alphaproteobacteria bacterium]|nr:serine/threonine protein kinase [Alphaproteobacteria bacterium]MCB9697261.1 serine/threonine protein kinase [Alphaproteobacteria bacterium]
MGNEELVGGVVAGKYRLDEHLRPGRFGDFWLGTRLSDKAKVVVKLLKLENFSNDKAIQRFERETKVLSSLDHPNLLRVLDNGVTVGGAPWVVTEVHTGRMLSDDIAELDLSVERVAHIGAQIADVLAHAHSRGVIHRGLEPEAVLLVEVEGDRDRVKVLDFGLSNVDDSDIAEDGPQLTQVGERLGRFEYMAPEYVEEQVIDARTDLYALGILLFEMLTGQPPFVGRALSVMQKQVEEEPFPPSELAAEVEVPEWLDAVVLSLLAKNPDERPQSGADVARILRNHGE